MSRPVRLHKQPDNVPPFYNLDEKLEAFVLSHASFFLILGSFIAGVLFIVICFKLVGISAVESGGMRNFLARGL